jgi:hypothetical protein
MMKRLKVVLIVCLFVALVIIIRNSFAQFAQKDNNNKEFIPCLDSPSGYMPNPRTYPEFYDRNSPIHKAVVLHRRHLNCADDSLHEETMKGQEEQIIKLDGSYCNYICRNRKQEQCYDDGTFDTYYDEWCEDADGNKIDVTK